jgi:hypothetical protein
MPEAVIPTLGGGQVRKWRRMLLALADESEAVPAAFFTAEFLPLVMPAAFKQLGFVTTDGATVADAVASESTTMLQSLTPVRRDLTGREQSVTVVLGEQNAWVNALAHGLPVADWPTDKDGPWLFDDGEITDWPFYRLLLIGQDGVGAKAIYRVEFGYKAGITAKTDRSMGQAAETTGVTFGLFLDDTVGLSLTRGQNGPSLNPAP